MEETFPFHYTLKDYLLCLFGLVMSLVDIGLDCWTVVTFYQNGEYVYMAVLIFLLLGSSLLVQVYSWLWYSESLDNLQTHVEKYVNKHNLLKAFHFMLLGVYLRFAYIMCSLLNESCHLLSKSLLWKIIVQFVLFVPCFQRYAGLVEISTHRFFQTDRFQEGVSVNLNHDLFMLRLIEAFAENAPQLTLMMSIIAMRQELTLVTGLS